MFIGICIVGGVAIVVLALVLYMRMKMAQSAERLRIRDEHEAREKHEYAQLRAEFKSDLETFMADKELLLDEARCSERWKELYLRRQELGVGDYEVTWMKANTAYRQADYARSFLAVATQQHDSFGEHLVAYARVRRNLSPGALVTEEQADDMAAQMSERGSEWITNLLDSARADAHDYAELKQFFCMRTERETAPHGSYGITGLALCRKAGISFEPVVTLQRRWYGLLAQYETAPLLCDFIDYEPTFVGGEFLAHMTQLLKDGQGRPLWEHKLALAQCHSGPNAAEYRVQAGTTREELQKLVTDMERQRQIS